MRIEQIRNATIRVTYKGTTFLVDPWLAPKDGFGCFAELPFELRDSQKRHVSMPICELVMPVEEILKGVDYYLITHIHPDHIDMAPDGTVGRFLDKKIPVLVQNEEDAQVFKNSGFESVQVVSEQGSRIGEARITKVPAVHGTLVPFGHAMGVMMEGEEKTLYIAGDTVWCSEVEKNLDTYQPQVIVLNACAAELGTFGRLLMDDHETEMVIKAAPQAEVIISHMDNVAHASISRTMMEDYLKEHQLLEHVRIPEDGESMEF